MRKIIVTELITLDGVVEAPGGKETDHPHAGWQMPFRSPEGGKYKLEEVSSVEALLLGKTTYEGFKDAWPKQIGTPFGDRMNQLPKYVVSTSLQKVEWNNCHLLPNLAGVAALKKGDGGDILVYGSAALVKALLREGLVDELRLMVCPVSVGGGLRLFDDQRDLTAFDLKQARALSSGVVVLEYQLSH